MINRGLQAFVHDIYGAEKWEEACIAADFPFYSFESMLHYEDAVTVRLLETLSTVLDRDKTDILEDLGTYIVSEKRMKAVRRLLRFGGETYVDFLYSLEDVYDRVKTAMPVLEVPKLSLIRRPENIYTVHCEFSKPGFGPVILGMLRGMADDYGALVFVEHQIISSNPVAKDRFDVHLIEEAWKKPTKIRRFAI